MRIVLKVLNHGTGIAIRIVSSIGHIVSALYNNITPRTETNRKQGQAKCICRPFYPTKSDIKQSYLEPIQVQNILAVVLLLSSFLLFIRA
jgi:hypothetical protein